MMTAVLVAQLIVSSAAPPLKPADAAATLRRASPDLDLSRGLFPLDALPFVINVFPERPSAQPSREHPNLGLGPRIDIPGITYRLPRGRDRDRREPARDDGGHRSD